MRDHICWICPIFEICQHDKEDCVYAGGVIKLLRKQIEKKGAV